jgi:predicted RNase H-like nuclease (RuvC/YqgF family)
MKNTTTKKEAQKVLTAQPEAEMTTVAKGDYTRFFYRSIEQLKHDNDELINQNGRLWDEVQKIQNELNGVRKSLHGA